MIYIIGHIKPDLDSAVASVSLKYLFDKKPCFQRFNSQPVLASEANFETKTIFTKFKAKLPPVLLKKQVRVKDKFVLVDHNEPSQRFDKIADQQVIDIFDHHKAFINLPTPIYITIKPWGSTNTLIFHLMEVSQIKPEKNLAGLMISAILSDTVALKSPTTTIVDKQAVKKLNSIAKIKDLKGLVLEIFKAKSSLAGLTDKQILAKDYKIYQFSGKKVLIGQVETVEQEKLIIKSEQLIKSFSELKKDLKLNHAFCVITDILRINSKCFVNQEDEKILIKAFPKSKKIKEGVFDLGPILSRKKEIAPAIENSIL